MAETITLTVTDVAQKYQLFDIVMISKNKNGTTKVTTSGVTNYGEGTSNDVKEDPKDILAHLSPMLEVLEKDTWFDSHKISTILDENSTDGRTVIIFKGGGIILTDEKGESLQTRINKNNSQAIELPQTIKEAAFLIIGMMGNLDKVMLKYSHKNKLIVLHRDLDKALKYRMNLWQENDVLLTITGEEHLDDAEAIIMGEVWEQLQKNDEIYA